MSDHHHHFVDAHSAVGGLAGKRGFSFAQTGAGFRVVIAAVLVTLIWITIMLLVR